MRSARAYYNENDPLIAAWLRELIKEKVLADGEVDERSIEEVWPEDVAGFTQCHFFAGVGVWSYALRIAGWPDERPVWTGSCPCPSFSAAGKGKGFDDARHLWPAWARLIRKCRPATVFGEQVDGAIGYGWLDLVQTDLERENYAVGKAVLGACSVGAPHIRQRLYFVAHSTEARLSWNENGRTVCEGQSARPRADESKRVCGTRGLVHTESQRCGEERTGGRQPKERAGGTGEIGDMGNAIGAGLQERERVTSIQRQTLFASPRETTERGSYVGGFWRDVDWVLRKKWNSDDSEWCPIEPGTFPLVTGDANRVLKLRGYGNAICAEVARAFIEAYLSIPE